MMFESSAIELRSGSWQSASTSHQGFSGPSSCCCWEKQRKKQDGEFDLREEGAIHPYVMTKLSQFEGRLKTESEL